MHNSQLKESAAALAVSVARLSALLKDFEKSGSKVRIYVLSWEPQNVGAELVPLATVNLVTKACLCKLKPGVDPVEGDRVKLEWQSRLNSYKTFKQEFVVVEDAVQGMVLGFLACQEIERSSRDRGGTSYAVFNSVRTPEEQAEQNDFEALNEPRLERERAREAVESRQNRQRELDRIQAESSQRQPHHHQQQQPQQQQQGQQGQNTN